MAFIVGQIVWFDSVFGFARGDGTVERIFLHENQRVQPYPTPNGVAYSRSASQRDAARGLEIRLRVSEGRKGLRATEWMYLDDFCKAKQRSEQLRREKSRRRRPTKRASSRAVA